MSAWFLDSELSTCLRWLLEEQKIQKPYSFPCQPQLFSITILIIYTYI